MESVRAFTLEHDGHVQTDSLIPYGRSVRISFGCSRAFFNFSVELMSNLSNGPTEIWQRDKLVVELPDLLTSYSSGHYTDSDGHATITIHSEDLIQGIVVRNGQVFYIDPLRNHEQHISQATLAVLRESQVRMVLYVEEDVIVGPSHTHLFGAAAVSESDDNNHRMTPPTITQLAPLPAAGDSALLQQMLFTADRWTTGCFPDRSDSTTVTV